ncbi:MAG: arylsulfatase [Rhodospirillaceae bacterium]|nr:arylsulfatase [Rhodospirillaceae bacterium]
MTEPVLAFVHTIDSNIAAFDAMIGELAPGTPVRHALRDDLLKEALDAGELTGDIRARTAEAVVAEAEKGAALLLCTCSTIGPGADDAAQRTATPVLRIARPMAEEAVSRGTRIGVAATLATTLGPTMDLLSEAAEKAGREVALTPAVYGEARDKLMAGDMEGYVRIIADGLRETAKACDVIVLAQASMAPALDLCSDITVPILTSPRSGLAAAVESYRKIRAAG